MKSISLRTDRRALVVGLMSLALWGCGQSYSTDGTEFTPLGSSLTLDHTWALFMGYRFAIFNYATQALGGSVKVASFQLTTP